VALPVDKDDELMPSLLTLSDVMATGHHAALSAGVGPGKTVAVVGDGAVGLMAVLAAKQLGAERIIAMSRHPERQKLARHYGATDIVEERGDEGIAKISLVGAGMKSHPGVAADMFDALAEAGINIEIISTSSIRVSCVISAAQVERAVQVVHARFQSFAEERVNG